MEFCNRHNRAANWISRKPTAEVCSTASPRIEYRGPKKKLLRGCGERAEDSGLSVLLPHQVKRNQPTTAARARIDVLALRIAEQKFLWNIPSFHITPAMPTVLSI
jgi:hypothetical protein